MRPTFLDESAVGSSTLDRRVHASACMSPTGIKGALDDEFIGLLPTENFRLCKWRCTDREVAKDKLYYFENELIAVPKNGMEVSGFNQGVCRKTDVVNWAATSQAKRLDLPSLVWIGAPSILLDAYIMPGGERLLTSDGSELNVKLVPPRPANRSYANRATAEYFEGRKVRMRGTVEEVDGKPLFVARTIWPTDFSFDTNGLTSEPLRSSGEFAALVRQPIRQKIGVDIRLLWERHPCQARDWHRKPVLGMVLSGAQGDNTKSLGGHIAVVTGRFGDKGDWSDWAVNNFYSLDSANEKGIISAIVPMDSYLTDLNSGQQYYRPSYMLVAVLGDQHTAVAFQGGVQRVFNHFYRRDFQYHNATANCAGISMDVLDSLGWHIPRRGPSAPLKAIAAYAYVALKEGSLSTGRKMYDYLNEEQTRLLPAVAFEAAALDLLRIVDATDSSHRVLSGYEERLRNDVEAIFLVRIPQIPSSRAEGSAPAFSFDEFRSRVAEMMPSGRSPLPGSAPFPAGFVNYR